MAYDKTWNFSQLNQIPADQTLIKNQAQSFMAFLKTNLMAIGWTAVANSNGSNALSTPVFYSQTILLPDGRVLVVGGLTSFNGATTNTWFGTISGNTITWVAGTALPTSNAKHTLTLLGDGRILITGGTSNNVSPVNNTYFGTISGNTITWIAGTALSQSKWGHTATLLPDGRILVTGGATNGSVTINNTYLGTISSNTITWVASTALPLNMTGHLVVLLSDGRVLLTGGTQDITNSLNTTYFGTITGDTITWVAGSSLPQALHGHSFNLLADGRLLITGGAATYSGAGIASTYFGTIAGNTITWVSGTNLPTGMASQVITILSDGRLAFIGGSINNSNPVAYTTYLASLSGITLSYSGPGINNGDSADWTGTGAALIPATSAGIRSWILLASPLGFVPGPDGSYLGAQSQMYLCLEYRSNNVGNYTNFNLTFYSTLPTGINNIFTIPFGGNPQSIDTSNSTGTIFINTSLFSSRFHFASTAAGGFYAGISSASTGIMSTLMGFIDLADVQLYGANPYPYAAVGFHYYNYTTTNLTYNVFDSVANTQGIKCFNKDGSAGVARSLIWANPVATLQIPGTGTTTAAGDINGNILESPIYIYNTSLNKCAMLGRLPDFKATGVSGVINSSVDNIGTPNYTYINQLLIPATAAILT